MVASRVRVAKDKASLMQELVIAKGNHATFETYADAVVFAACLGFKHQKPVPLEAISTREPAPISLEVFISRGYDAVIKLIAITATENPQIISSFDSSYGEQRIRIFEEYTNGGLEILRQELRGAVEYTDRILLMVSKERSADTSPEGEFDLSRFL